MKKVKKVVAFLLVFTMVFVTMPTNPGQVNAARKKEVKVKSVTLNQNTYTLKKGKSVRLKASLTPKNTTQKSLVWSSSKKTVATVSSKGVVKALKNGQAKITVKVKGTSKKAICRIFVGTPVSKVGLNVSKKTLEVGKKVQLKAMVLPKNATIKTVKFTTSNKKIAKVSSKGLVTAVAVGTAKITATTNDGTGKKTQCIITVKKPATTTSEPETTTAKAEDTTKDSEKIKVSGISFEENQKTLTLGETYQTVAVVSPYNASNKALMYTSDNPAVAVVDNTGRVTTKAVGTARIKAAATDGSNKAATMTVNVVPVYVSKIEVPSEQKMKRIEVGESFTISTSVVPPNATNKNLTYESSDGCYVASVDQNGKVTGVGAGDATITIRSVDGKAMASIHVVVQESDVAVTGLSLNRTSIEFMLNSEPVQLKADVKPENATKKDIKWTSDNPEIATVTETGIVSPAGSSGEANIIATTVDGNFEAKCCVKVENGVKVTSSSELMKLINGKDNYKIIEFVTDEEELNLFSEADKDFSKTILRITAPNATIINSINFKQVEINSIKGETYTEKADNFIVLYAEKSHINIDEGASATIKVEKSVKYLNLENNGNIENLIINTDGEIKIQGTSNQTSTPAIIKGEATIYTTKCLEITAEEKSTLILQAGSENTTVTAEDKESIPKVEGLGSIVVSVGNDEQIIIAENTDKDVGAGNITEFMGKIQDISNNDLKDAKVYLIPYYKDFDLEDSQEKALWSDTTDENGEYHLTDIKVGNYYLVIRKLNYQDVIQTCIFKNINSGTIVTNDTITMAVEQNLCIKGFQTNDIVTSYEIFEEDEYVQLYMTDRDVEAALANNKIVPIIEQEGSTYKVEEGDDGEWYIKLTGNNGVVRSYWLDISQDYGNLCLNNIICSDGSMTKVKIIDNHINIYGTKESFEEIKNSLTFQFGQDVDDHELIYDEEWKNWFLVLTRNSDEFTRRYLIYYYIDYDAVYGNLCITNISSSLETVTVNYYENTFISLKIQGIEFTQEMQAALQFTYGKEGVTGTFEQDENGTWHYLIEDGILTRSYILNLRYKYPDTFSIQSVESSDGSLLDYCIYDEDMDLYGTKESYSEIKDSLDFKCGSDVVRWELGVDGAEYCVTLYNSSGVTRKYYLYYSCDYGDLGIVDISFESENISYVSYSHDRYSSGKIEIGLYEGINFTEEIRNSLDFSYGKDGITGKFIYDENADEYSYVLTDSTSGRKRTYKVTYTYDDKDLDNDEILDDDSSFKIVGISFNHDDISYVSWSVDRIEICLEKGAAFTEEIRNDLEFIYGKDGITGEFVYNEETEEYSYILTDSTNGETKSYKVIECWK